MILRGIKFPNAMAASGTDGNFGEGYWYQRLEEECGILDKTGLGFVSKTCTAELNIGFTPYIYDGDTFPPAKLKPSSIKINPFSKNVINSVGLSNPGIEAMLATGHWQALTEPFMISVMCIEKTWADRLHEMKSIVAILKKEIPRFNAPFCLQINLSCPNTGHDTSELASEAKDLIKIAADLGVPIMAKFSIATSSIEGLMEIEKDPNLDAICLSNTIPYYWEPDTLFYGNLLASEWKKPFGEESPLHKVTKNPGKTGGGGISGEMIRPFVLHFIKKLRDAGFKKHIHGGGGIMEAQHVIDYKNAGADSIFFASVVMVRPLNVQGIIRKAEDVFSENDTLQKNLGKEMTEEQIKLKETLEALGAVITGQIFFYKKDGTFGPAYINKEKLAELGALKVNNILRDVVTNAINHEGFWVDNSETDKKVLVIGPAYGATSYPGVVAEALQRFHDSGPLFLASRTELDREDDKLHVIPDKLMPLYQQADEFIIIEDIVNGGTTIKQIVELIRSSVSETAPISAFCLVDRGENNTAENLGIKAFHPLIKVDMPVKNINDPEDVRYLNHCDFEINTVLGKGKKFIDKHGTRPYTVEQLTQSA